MGSVYSDQDHHGNRILNADLTGIDPSLLHPDVLTVDEVVAGAGILVTPEAGTLVVSAAPSVSSYRERFVVADPGAQEPLVVVHGLGAAVVSVTVAEVGTPTSPVSGQVTFVDENTVEVLLTGESAGEFEVLVLADGAQGGSGTPGPAGPQGDPGPSAVSGDEGNLAVLGTDSLIHVPVTTVDGMIDAAISGVVTGAYLPLTGGTVTGPIIVARNPMWGEGPDYAVIGGERSPDPEDPEQYRLAPLSQFYGTLQVTQSYDSSIGDRPVFNVNRFGIETYVSMDWLNSLAPEEDNLRARITTTGYAKFFDVVIGGTEGYYDGLRLQGQPTAAGGGGSIFNLVDLEEESSATTKKYVDSQVAALVAQVATLQAEVAALTARLDEVPPV